MMCRCKKAYQQQEERDKNIVSYLLALLQKLGSPQSTLHTSHIWCPHNIKRQEPFPFLHNRLLRIKWSPTIAHTRNICKGLKLEIPVSERTLHNDADTLWNPGIQVHVDQEPTGWKLQRQGRKMFTVTSLQEFMAQDRESIRGSD